MISAMLAVDRGVSLRDTKPRAVCDRADRLSPAAGQAQPHCVDVIITVGALEAIVGIVQ